MNGELLELYNKVHSHLETFKAVMEERWKNHANRDDRIDRNVENIVNKLDGLPCNVNMKRTEQNEENIKLIYTNHLKHINDKLNGLFITVIGSVLLTILAVGIKYLLGINK